MRYPDEARTAHDEAVAPAWKTYDAFSTSWEVYSEAVVATRKARNETMDAAWKAYGKAVKRLHEKECLDCPWDGQTIFPGKGEAL